MLRSCQNGRLKLFSTNEETSDKGGGYHLEGLHDRKVSKKEQLREADETLARPDVTLDIFSHLDVNKILRQIYLRLLLILTLLACNERVV